MSTTVRGAIIYPYVMQDHLLREKADRTYKALFLENEYLKVTCLPELGGRLHSVFDKTRKQEMFHCNERDQAGHDRHARRVDQRRRRMEHRTARPHGDGRLAGQCAGRHECRRVGLPGDQQPGATVPHALDRARHAASRPGVPGRADLSVESDRRHAPVLLLELHGLSQPAGHAVHLSDEPGHGPRRTRVLPLADRQGPRPVVAQELPTSTPRSSRSTARTISLEPTTWTPIAASCRSRTGASWAARKPGRGASGSSARSPSRT